MWLTDTPQWYIVVHTEQQIDRCEEMPRVAGRKKKKKNLDEMFICQGYKLSISCPQAYLSAFRILHT